MAMRGGWTINGTHFQETHSSGLQRFTHRFFINGKLVSKPAFYASVEEAKKAEKARELDADSTTVNQ